jgi:hypothetical protein
MTSKTHQARTKDTKIHQAMREECVVICVSCFKVVHNQCARSLDEDGKKMCAACDTKPQAASSDASRSSGTVIET